jgi:hypothetical protein
MNDVAADTASTITDGTAPSADDAAIGRRGAAHPARDAGSRPGRNGESAAVQRRRPSPPAFGPTEAPSRRRGATAGSKARR